MAPLNNTSFSSQERPRWLFVGMAANFFLLIAFGAMGQNAVPSPPADEILTNITQIWGVPPDRKNEEHRIRFEAVIYYYDQAWSDAWGECGGKPTWLPIYDSPVPFKVGQRIAIDGWVVPGRGRFIWDKTQVRILEENVDTKAEVIGSLSDKANELKDHLVSVEGLVDRQLEEPTHVTLTFLNGVTSAGAFVLKNTNSPPLGFKEGDFIRMKCVYSPQFDRDGSLSSLSLWVARPEDIEVIGSLGSDPRFTLPISPISDIQYNTPTNNVMRVEGVVRSHEQGKWVTIWDRTGQVMVQSAQTQPLRFGDRVEAIGYPYVLGVQQTLHGGMYRLTTSTNAQISFDTPPFYLAERIRDLSRAEAGRRSPVNLRAVVTWSHPETPFAFVQDGSGGIRVANPKWDGANTSKPGTIVTISGEVTEGDYVPVITNAVISPAGWWNLAEPRLVTLEQVMTGVEDGRWVAMRGFVREVTRFRDLVRLDLSTSSGDFQAIIPASQSYDFLKGSIIRVQGVCSAVANDRHQLTGIQILVPEAKYTQVEEPAPDDLFAVMFRPIGDLRRFNMERALNRRIRTSGTVVLQSPGRYLYVQDGTDSVFALSQQQDVLKPGDRVEVVGFPGNEGRRFLLREAVYRRVSDGKEPRAFPLSAVHSVNVDLEGLLAKAQGILLNKVEKDGETRLLIQSEDSAFEVSLDATNTVNNLQTLQLGSQLDVTGVYEVQSDEYGRPRSFLLHLRSWNDIQLLQLPSWWTFGRLLWVLSGVIVVSATALIWGFLISRKNKLLRQAQGELQSANDKLELRVEERTRALREQVAAKERARAELAQTQKNLMHASRQAGMAEVATGVLHNVGNVLNSVNVSAAMLADRLHHSRVDSVGKTAALLKQHQNQLAQFMTEDPKGRALPDYLEKLAESLVEEKRVMHSEIQSLTKHIDHIKVVVSMQQSYAQVGGVLEDLDPKSLMEDAVQINYVALDRHGIQLVRNYHDVPHVMVDRHKILQILVNLINNAKHALDKKASDKRLVLTIEAADSDRIRLIVNDNGMGIPTENLNRIFSQGFTTRKDGHGFGLNSGAIAAKELGGSLSVCSEGTGHGATFTLELPVANGAAPKTAPAHFEAALI